MYTKNEIDYFVTEIIVKGLLKIDPDTVSSIEYHLNPNKTSYFVIIEYLNPGSSTTNNYVSNVLIKLMDKFFLKQRVIKIDKLKSKIYAIHR